MNILLADDHPLFREGVKLVISQLGDAVNIIDAHDYPSLFKLAEEHPDVDLAVVDLNMPGMLSVHGIRQFRISFPGIPLVVLTASESTTDAQRALSAGALGFVQKSLSSRELLDAFRRVLDGEIYLPPNMDQPASNASAATQDEGSLTTRQREVLHLLLQGKPNKVIARELNLSEGTVKIHVAGAFRALNVNNRVEAAIAARQLGLDSQ